MIRHFAFLAVVVTVAMTSGARHADSLSRDAAISGDFDCDTRPDSARLVHSDSSGAVLLYRGTRTRPDSFTFRIGGPGRAGLNGQHVRIAAVKEGYTPGADDTPMLPGYRPVGCAGIQLTDDDTDSYWLYWNSDARRLDFWRR